jgi:hypothetical protein
MANGDTPPVSLMDREGLNLDDENLQAVEVEALPGDLITNVEIEGIEIVREDDGGATLDFDPFRNRDREDDFYDNLAEFLPDSVLAQVSNELMEQYSANRASRQDWEDAYSKGLELLGFNYEERTEPFRGATGVTHPLLAEAAVQFQAQAFNELLPADGPVRTTVLGSQTTEKMDQAKRVQDFMNYYITNVMEEYTPEFDQMLFYLPLAGSTFKKVYYDETISRAVSKFVPAEDIVVPYGATDLNSCENITQVVKMSLNDLRIRQVMGFYRDLPVTSSENIENEVLEEMNKLGGVEPTNLDYECTLLECHINLDLPGFEDIGEDNEPTGIKVPYIVTLSEDNGQILSIRRNYKEQTDGRKKKIQYFVHYKFLPGFGFYGLGLIHTIGGLSRTATAALRQLIDAGTLSNLPAGFKARGLRVRDDEEPLQPGEFRDVDAPGGAIRDSLMPLPFKGPDGTLMQLLGFVVEAGRRFATITDMKVGDGNQQAAVGTTVALLEQGSRVMSAVHKRMHYSMKQEFKLLAQVMSEYLPQKYPYAISGGDRAIMREDFDNRVDVIPVSNPNVFSQAQRIAMAQSQLEMAMQAPQMHDMHEAYRRMYEALGVNDIDKILIAPSSEDPIPKDPAQENIDVMDMVQLKAFEGQDHDAHIMTHLVFATAPTLQAIPQVPILLQKHVIEHVKLKSQEMATAQMLQQTGGQPLNAEQELQLESMTAKINAEEFQKLKQLSAQVSGQGQQGPDPLIQLKQQELQMDQQKMQQDAQMDQAELQIDQQRMQNKATEFQQRLASQERQTKARIDAAMQRELLKKGE